MKNKPDRIMSKEGKPSACQNVLSFLDDYLVDCPLENKEERTYRQGFFDGTRALAERLKDIIGEQENKNTVVL